MCTLTGTLDTRAPRSNQLIGPARILTHSTSDPQETTRPRSARMVSPAPVSPYYPTPQSPGARSATPSALANERRPVEMDTAMQQEGEPLSGEANARVSGSADGHLLDEPVGTLPGALVVLLQDHTSPRSTSQTG